jgi:DNA polymerase I-like protein with 3'-5' exonuclease and polymerase domains
MTTTPSNAPQTDIHTAADSSSTLSVTLGTTTVTFTEWLPSSAPLSGSIIAADTETTRIDKANPWMTPTIVLMQAYDGDRGVFIAPENVPAFMAAHRDSYFAFHSAAFDLRVINKTHERLGVPYDVYTLVDARQVIDTWILYKLIVLGKDGHAVPGRGQSTLAAALKACVGVDLPKEDIDEDGDDTRTSFAKYLRHRISDIAADALQYAAKDVLAAHALLVALMQRLEGLRENAHRCFGYVNQMHLDDCWQEYGPLTHDTQLRGAIVCDVMRSNGIHIDIDRREEKLRDLDQILNEHGEALMVAGIPVSTSGSIKAIQQRLEKIVANTPGLELHLTPGGKFSTKAEDLAEAAMHDEDGVLMKYVEYKAAEKLKSTYMSKMTGRLHPRFGILKVTGRTNCTGDLALQTIPKESGAKATTMTVRKCIVASPGHEFVMADFAQIELVVLAFAWKYQFQFGSRLHDVINSGNDVHRIIAGTVLGISPEDVTDDQRKGAKAISFGAPGRMGPQTLQKLAKNNYGKDLNIDEVKVALQAYHTAFPELTTFLDRHPERGDVDSGLEVAKHLRLTARAFDEGSGQRHRDQQDSDEPAVWIGWMLLKVLGDPAPQYKDGRPYEAEKVDYFWDTAQRLADILPGNNKKRQRLTEQLRRRQPSRELRSAVVNHFDKTPVISATGRIRAGARATASRNTIFQSVAADGGLLALWKLFRAGCRVVAFIHDEIVVEIPVGSDREAHAAEIARLMIEGMHEVIPGMLVKVEAFVSPSFSKAEAVLTKKYPAD